ncbi:hypothetical protein HUE58_02680 [Candidatus Ruthia endofausta]|uniref:Uncharacterized protein n=1 Tax=Candidatus Ruthia endofausta TaxID=2738852 RepID=A0A6N0HP66_9GAMM|nr:hypothetical protein [Candidatus Ruthia endofausta]QKQ24077.1 hypothetical protein HUE58_02680 [Candidatus Ruthia endofausta]
MNDKANEFFNQFGSGRMQISIHGLSSKELDYSIKTIQPISELNDNIKGNILGIEVELTPLISFEFG